MKQLVTFLILNIYCHFSFAQGVFPQPGVSGKISGIIIDGSSQAPVDYATISLFSEANNKLVNGIITDEKGTFKFNDVPVGNYKIKISFIGYTDKEVADVRTTGGKPDLDLGKITLIPQENVLQEVSISANTATVVNKIDKLVYNVEKDVTAAGGNAADVLQKVPMVSVDLEGKVSIRGDGNVRVLINGKPTGASSATLADVLKTIPADQIKNIEVVTSPSAKYDAEGSAGIINIITKQKSVSGFSGSVSGGLGTRQNNGNLNLNYNRNRFTFGANLGFNNGWPQESTTSSYQRIENETANSMQTSSGKTTVKRIGYMASLTAGYEFNAFNSLNTSFRLNRGKFSGDGNSQSINQDFLNPANSLNFTSQTSSSNSFGGFDWNVDYTHKFNETGHELILSGIWTHNINKTDYQNLYSDFYTNQKAHNVGDNDEYTVQLDYTLPVGEKIKIEAGGKSVFRKISSDVTNYVPSENGAFVYDPINSNLYDYDQDVFAGYAVGTYSLGQNYTFMAGARVEHTSINGNPKNALQSELRNFSIDYNTFIPSFTFQKKFSEASSLKLTYSKRITRPSLNFLNPFLNQSNIQAQTQGNPELDPEISQTVELGYSYFSKKTSVSASVYYKNTSGLIEGIAAPLSDGTGTLTTYQNIGDNNSFGSSLFGSVNPIESLTFRGNVNAYTYKPDPTGIFSQNSSQNDTYLQYSAFVSGTWVFKKNLSAELFMIQNSSRRTIQGTNPSFNLMVLGVKKQFWDKSASLGININSPFKKDLEFNRISSGTGFQYSSNFAIPMRSISLTFSYNFGKMSFGKTPKKSANSDQPADQQNGGMMVPGQ